MLLVPTSLVDHLVFSLFGVVGLVGLEVGWVVGVVGSAVELDWREVVVARGNAV